ncbi:bifunctional DNA primase/polymerase [Streptomyces sp. GMY02]|uniref:bifunctional DNA primase/polymerase n=1 Tax=Streptomyces sp. GMY02 TaxID=1333528 RepID=UPI001C2BA53D|nr:bifunctional DNA primase/polymerase [Streptomyces sp. GMY02]QXE36950.1 bifunctional DNA primase/polymerase [Streptomyces sp. GMY02]
MTATKQAAALPPVIEFAQWYGKRGWRVLPLHHVVDGRCTCGNPKQDAKHDYKQGGKHPVYSAWQDNATTNPSQIAAWWGERPLANIGIATGEASGIFVLDVDPDNGGFDSLTALETEHGPLPETRRHETGSGGLHFFFAWPGFNPRNSSGKLGPGLDIRADGGQVVAPPSISVKGPYAPQGGPDPVEAPTWLLDLLRPPAPREPLPPGTYTAPVGNQDAYTNKAVQDECDAIVSALDGMQNDTINRAAFNVGTLVGAGALSEGEARETLLSAARAGNHPEGRALATIESGLRAGMAQPRHPWPPVSRTEDWRDFSTLLTPENEPRAASARAAPAGVQEQRETTAPRGKSGEGLTSEEHFEARLRALDEELLDTEDLDHIPALEPIVEDVLFKDTLARIYGASGTFKSFMTLDFAACVGTGTPWHGQRVRQGEVIYLVAEGIKGIRKRVRAWEQHHGTRMTGVKFLPRPVQAMDPEWLVLIELCRRRRPSLIVVDTQARVTVGIEENSNTEMGKVVDRMEQLRGSSGACVLLVHHTGHDSDRGRGATAVKGALQTEIGVERKGKGLLDSQVTLKTGKQKDDEELGDVVFGLHQVLLDGEAKEDGTPVSSIVLVQLNPAGEPQARTGYQGRVEEVAAALDAAGVPPGYGRDRLRAECTRLGIKVENGLLTDVTRHRKNQTNAADYLSANLSGVP